jgi:hypothetical protein
MSILQRGGEHRSQPLPSGVPRAERSSDRWQHQGGVADR